MLLIFGDQAQWDAMTPEEWKTHDAAHEAFRDAAGAGVKGGAQLESPQVATTLRAGSDGGLLLTDGPFLETKEGLGGYYLVEADDLDQVTKLAALLPEVRASHSAVEIRPVVDHG
ncbi:YciI family protein [Asanoa sp. NPDC049475]